MVAGQLALDFANTVDDPDGPHRWDHVATYRDLLTWLHAADVISSSVRRSLLQRAGAHPRAAENVVQRAAALRAALQALFTAVAGDEDGTEGWKLLEPFVATALRHATLSRFPTAPEAAEVLIWPLAEDLEAPLWPVADSAYQLLRGPDLGLVKRCHNCPWLFVDKSKNHSRRWCSMADCGTAVKISRGTTARRRRRAGTER